MMFLKAQTVSKIPVLCSLVLEDYFKIARMMLGFRVTGDSKIV